MKHVDTRKLTAATQEECRRQVVGLRDSGLTYEAISAQYCATICIGGRGDQAGDLLS
jgi:hypothetical protein